MRTIFAIVLAIILFSGGWYLLSHTPPRVSSIDTGMYIPDNSLVTPAGIGFKYATSTYGLATTAAQVLVKSYIPPCDAHFDYCLYRRGGYEGTNFESAGLAIKLRTDLTTHDACLATPPESFSESTPKTREGDGYATAVFAPIGDAAAGHYSSGALYRVSFGTTCYEFEARIGESQFANYPAGAITKFTDDDRATVYAELIGILNSVNIAAQKTPIIFPALDERALP